MLVFAGITPHPPILIPTIGRGNLKKIDKTKLALQKMEEDLYATHPETIIVISPHGSFFRDAFTINSCPEFIVDLKEFGDLITRLKFPGDLEIAYRLRAATKRQKINAVMLSESVIDHGSAVPLFYLAAHLPQVKIILLGFSEQGRKIHLDFGRMIQEVVAESNKRVAVIASGDLSHALSTNAPAGFNPAGPEFDAKIRELLMTGHLAGLAQVDKKLIADSAQCGYRSLLILAGILQKTNYAYRELTYEAPFGIGYLTAEFEL